MKKNTDKIKHVVTSYIDYDKTIPISAVSDNVLSFLHLERLFENFRIVTDYRQRWLGDLDLDAKITYVFKKGKRKSLTALQILQSKAFLDYVNVAAKPDRKYLLYHPINPPYTVNPLYFIMNSPTISHAYENKMYFRDEFSDIIRIPDYKVVLLSEITSGKISYKSLQSQFGKFVMQDEDLSGSKGTFMINNEKEFLEARVSLKIVATSRSVIVSKMIIGESVGTQVCITKYGSFSSGIQRMIIGSKILTNLELDGVSTFGGGEVGIEYSDKVNAQVNKITQAVSEKLGSHGYKGIFGIDLIITPDDEVYAIEVNARMTAFTHIVADMQLHDNQIPFLLLHVLELGGYKYEVKNFQALPSRMRPSKPVSYVIMHNQCDHEFRMPTYIKPGVYSIVGGSVKYVRGGYSISDLRENTEVLIASKYKKSEEIARGERVYTLIFNGTSMKGNGLNRRAAQMVRAVNTRFGIDFKAETEYYNSPLSKVSETIKKTTDAILHPIEEVDKAAKKFKDKFLKL